MIFNANKIPFPTSGSINIDEVSLGIDNTKTIGLFLYTDYFIIFQISGFLLLLAMIGAIVLAQNKNTGEKRISPQKQKNIQKKNVINLN